MILLLEMEHVVITASIASSVFIVFAMPQAITAKARNLIGGHMIGLLSGSLFGLVSHPTMFLSDVLYALSVGCAIFLMVVTDTEHPPAAGTALGVVLIGFSLNLLLSIITSIVLLALVHRLLRSSLMDLV